VRQVSPGMLVHACEKCGMHRPPILKPSRATIYFERSRWCLELGSGTMSRLGSSDRVRNSYKVLFVWHTWGTLQLALTSESRQRFVQGY
jgi:hypothetical protein